MGGCRQLARSRVLGGQSDRGVHPGERVAEDENDRQAGEDSRKRVVEPIDPPANPSATMIVSDRTLRGEICKGTAGQYRWAGHWQAPESVDDSTLQILGQPDGCGHAPDEYRLQEDRRHHM